MRICSKCKSADVSFYKDKRGKNGFRSICKTCDIKKSLAWNKKHSKKHARHERKYRSENLIKMKINKKKYVTSNARSVKNSALKHHYGIDIDQFELMKVQQNNSCAVCSKHETNLTRSLCVDHSHSSGKVRSLLCASCNSVLGLIEENINTAKKIVKYLEDHSG